MTTPLECPSCAADLDGGLIANQVYESAVTGRREFRAAYRDARSQRDTLAALLREARDRIPDRETGVNKDLLARIDAALEGR